MYPTKPEIRAFQIQSSSFDYKPVATTSLKKTGRTSQGNKSPFSNAVAIRLVLLSSNLLAFDTAFVLDNAI